LGILNYNLMSHTENIDKTHQMNILAIVPARSGSQSIPNKNIRPLLGKPLMAYSIDHGLKSKYINRVVVSTDDKHYASIAREYGAEVPFLRPSEFSKNNSPDIEFFIHALDWFEQDENYIPDICVHLRPTHPIRNVEDIDKMIELLINNPDADSVRSVIENKTIIPYKMWLMGEDYFMKPLLHLPDIKEPYNTPRQALPRTFFQNASVDVIRTKCIREKKSLSGDNIMGYIMTEQFDIDYEEDFGRVERQMMADLIIKGNLHGKIICFDIDGVIASLTPDNNYALAMPISRIIRLVRNLYKKGNTIILYTARGTKTGINWKEITERQMEQWDVPYHELHFGKPGADIFIDDRAFNIFELITIIETSND
jgi:CMP-N,N'-diacetyllegionaminic acid synthase